MPDVPDSDFGCAVHAMPLPLPSFIRALATRSQARHVLWLCAQELSVMHSVKRISYCACNPESSQFAFLARPPQTPSNLQFCHAFTAHSARQVRSPLLSYPDSDPPNSEHTRRRQALH